MTIRIASYAKQTSSGFPLINRDHTINRYNVELLAKFDDVTLEMTPFARDITGEADARVPMLLRRLNPDIRIWMYVLLGDFWLPPTFVPNPADWSALRLWFDAINAGNGWLYGVDGELWHENYRVNLADEMTAWRLGDVLCSLVKLRLFDGIFLDDCHTSIEWTDKPERHLDVKRAGFSTLPEMDAARLSNITALIERLRHASGYGSNFLVATNGTGTPPSPDIEMREGIGRLVGPNEALEWIKKYRGHWLKAEAYSVAEQDQKAEMLFGLAALSGQGDPIISLGPDREWPPVYLTNKRRAS